MAQPPPLGSSVQLVADQAGAELSAAMAALTALGAAEAQAQLAEALASLVTTYGQAAATLAAVWYDEDRATAGVGGSFEAIPYEFVDDMGADALAGYAAQPLYAAEPDIETAQARAVGGIQRRVTNAARFTVMESAIKDPDARGWQRTGRGDSCPFCLMLISRGAVYRRSTVDFGSHDHCDCMAVPTWGGLPLAVKPYVPTSANITDADRARVRAWIASNH